MESEPTSENSRGERAFALLLLCALVAFALWGVAAGWQSRALPGNAFRQTQTAISAMAIQQEGNFSPAYPTPVLGKPWAVPFEFPLYQWTVVVTSDATGLSLIKSGRLVSALCFFLGLPAVWLLLGRMGVPWVRRVVALGMVLTCPLLLFYARAFLIETMALMFALWFLQAFVAAVEQRSLGWAVVANLAGVGAGLVKVTTFMVYLIPAGLWTLWWLWRARPRSGDSRGAGEFGRVLAWVAGTTIVPFAATYAWLSFSDRLKALNPSSRSLTSAALRSYNLGTWENRTDPEIWAAHWRTIAGEILPVATLCAVAVLVLCFRGRWARWAVGCSGLFVLAPVVFPVLYAWHEYYFTAVAVLPMLAVGLVLCGLFEMTLPRWRIWAVALGFFAMQAGAYLTFHYPIQRSTERGSSDLTEALRYTTAPGDVLVIAGEDWASITPFYAQRRALMLRRDMEEDWPYVREAFGNLAGEKVTALVLRAAQRENRQLLALAGEYFQIDPEPVYRWRDALVFGPRGQAGALAAKVAQLGLPELSLCRGETPPAPDGTITWGFEHMTPQQRGHFEPMGRMPLRYASRIAIGSSAVLAGRRLTGAHPETRIWFAATPGRHELRLEFAVLPGAYENLAREAATDGVEFVVAATRPEGRRRVLFSRLLNPFDEPADRGWQREQVVVELYAGEELVLETLPGPANSSYRDWAGWGRLDIK